MYINKQTKQNDKNMKSTKSAQALQQSNMRRIANAKKALISALRVLRTGSPAETHSARPPDCVSAATVRKMLDTSGVAVITHAFSDAALMSARAKAREAFKADIEPNLPIRPAADMSLFEITANAKFWMTGIVGNKGFGYMFLQPDAPCGAESITLSSNKQITVAAGGGFNANIELLTHPDSTHMLETLFAVTGNNVVSADSCKIHRGNMTPAHVDIYGDAENAINRHQAIAIGLAESTTRLCFLEFSNHENIKRLVCELVERDIYANAGFSKVPLDAVPDLVECFAAAGCIRRADPRDLVIWHSGVIHLEMNMRTDGTLSIAKSSMIKTATTERYIVGTHTMQGFTPRDMVELAYMHAKGFFFHPYSRKQHPLALKNSVHRKHTMYTSLRTKPACEIARLDNLSADIKHKVAVDGWLSQVSPAIKKCFGI